MQKKVNGETKKYEAIEKKRNERKQKRGSRDRDDVSRCPCERSFAGKAEVESKGG